MAFFYIIRKPLSTDELKSSSSMKYSITFKNAKGKSLDNDILISEDLLDFIKDNIFAVLDESIDVIKCYIIYKRNGNIYYGIYYKT